MSRPAAAAALAAAALALAAPAAAQDVTREELRELASRAKSDQGALEELRRVERVDGAPVDLEQALADADGEALERRLDALAEAADGPAGAAPAAHARGQAREILSERRFHGTDVPRPFRGPLRWLGDRIRAVMEAVPGGPLGFWILVGAIVAALAALVAARVGRRRSADAVARVRASAPGGAVDPRRLEEEAGEAEQRGDFERALRLLFRAGLVRLDRARAIVLRDSVTTGQVRRELRSADFDAVARVFDEVTYGRRAPGADDVAASRSGWKRVLEETGAR